MWVGYDSWVAHTQWNLHGQRKKTFRSCMTDIEFSISVEYNGWWLVVHPIVLQRFLYARWCRDSSINSSAQFLGITCIITWIAVGRFTPRSISSVLLSALWLWRWQVWLDVWIDWWWGSRPCWEDTLWIRSDMAWMVRKPRSDQMWVYKTLIPLS